MSSEERSRYVTVFQQTKETDYGEPGDRFLVHGEDLDTHYKFDEDAGDFIRVAEPLAVIDAGVAFDKDDLSAWCNSHAGQAVLKPYFPEVSEPDDPTLPDTGHLIEGVDDVE